MLNIVKPQSDWLPRAFFFGCSVWHARERLESEQMLSFVMVSGS